MRKLLLALVAVAAFMVGCSTTPEPADSIPNPLAPVDTGEAVEDAYLLAMNEPGSPFRGGVDQVLLDIGYAACDLLDVATMDEIVYMVITDGEFPPEQYGYALGAASGTLCPEHMAKVSAYSGS